jgi:Leucine-rich repeat (LRR) protein
MRAIASLCIIAAVTLFAASLSLAEEPVYFADANLKAAVEQALGKTDPTPTDMLSLTTLGQPSQIADLTGIEYAKNLQLLDVQSGWINDLGPLSGLGNLQCVVVSENRISDLSPLSGLTNLQVLGLVVNQISNLSPLSGLTNLQILELNFNHISDVSPLSGLTNLQWLNLNDNQISDPSPLSGLTNLQVLGLFVNQISNLSPLSGLTNLQILELNFNHISDVSPLSGLTNLQWLNLNDNQIRDLSPLSGLTKLTNLYLWDNQISDLPPLDGLTNLQTLNLESNQISDLSSLSGLTNLEVLALAQNPLNSEACEVYIPLIRANNPYASISDDCDVQKHTLTISSTDGGSVTSPGEGAFEYDDGTEVQLQAEADPGYHFTNWSGSIWSTDNPTTITMDKDYQITANFEPEGPQVPHTPTLIAPGSPSEPGPVINTLTPLLQWEELPGADFYALAMSEYPYGPEHIVYNPQELYGTSHSVPEGILQYGKKYRWNMQAHNAIGWSQVSQSLHFRMPAVALAELITQEALNGVPVTVDGEVYYILTLRHRIDPDTLEIIAESGPVVVYVDGQNDPVSDPYVVRKINLIDFVLDLVAEDPDHINLDKKIADLEDLQTEYKTFNSADMAVAGANLILAGAGDLLKLANGMLVITTTSEVLTTLDQIKTLAETKPTGILVEIITFIMKKTLWDPMEDMKADLQNRIAMALDSYRSAEGVLEKGDITRLADAVEFLSSYQDAQLYEGQSDFLFQKIFKNLGDLLIRVEPVSGILTGGLSDFVKLAREAGEAVDWTYDVDPECIRVTGEEACTRCFWFEDIQTARYTLALGGSSLSDCPDLYQQYSSCYEDSQKPIDELLASLGADNPINKALDRSVNALRSWKEDLSTWAETWKGKLGSWMANWSNCLLAMVFSPVELRIQDAEGRVAGVVDGAAVEDIPESVCLGDLVIIFHPSGSLLYEVVGTGPGEYSLEIAAVEGTKVAMFQATEVPIQPEGIHQYGVDWQVLSVGKAGVTISLDMDHDGQFERVIPSGAVLTRDGFIRSLVDFDDNDAIDFNDFRRLACNWLSLDCQHSQWCEGTDLDWDGKVDARDLATFAEVWRSAPQMDKPVAHWTFDEGTGFVANDSAGSNTGSVHGAKWVEGHIGGALRFDGSDDYVDCGSAAALASEQMTITFWMFVEGRSAYQYVLGKAMSMYVERDYTLSTESDGKLQFGFGESIVKQVLVRAGAGLAVGRWVHVAATRDGSTSALYLDGQLEASAPYSFVPKSTDHPLLIGSIGTPDPAGFFTGMIDDVRIYDQALSAEEIQAIFNEQ